MYGPRNTTDWETALASEFITVHCPKDSTIHDATVAWNYFGVPYAIYIVKGEVRRNHTNKEEVLSTLKEFGIPTDKGWW